MIGGRFFSLLRNKFRKDRTLSLRNHKHQGKTNYCVAAARESSHFFTVGAFTRFKDWRFIHLARLGLVKLNGYNRPTRRNPGPVKTMCRRCPNVETLPHILDHCMVHSSLYRKRHNAIISRIKKAAAESGAVL